MSTVKTILEKIKDAEIEIVKLKNELVFRNEKGLIIAEYHAGNINIKHTYLTLSTLKKVATWAESLGIEAETPNNGGILGSTFTSDDIPF